MTATTIGIYNESTLIPSQVIESAIPTYERFFDEAVRPHYPGGVDIIFAGTAMPPLGTYTYDLALSVRDTAPDPGTAGDLGYHTSADGQHGVGYVLAGIIGAAGADIHNVLMHEAIEGYGDLSARSIVALADGRYALKELCDPVTGYMAPGDWNGLAMPNFVLPAFWDGGEGPYDFNGELTAPCPSCLGGGYQELYDGQAWHMIAAFKVGATQLTWQQMHSGRRAYRRQFHPLTGARLVP